MKKKVNKLLLVLLSLMLLINTVGCKSNSKNFYQEKVFEETEIELPKMDNLFSLNKLSDNSLRLVFRNSEGYLKENYLPAIEENEEVLWLESSTGTAENNQDSILYNDNMKKNFFISCDISRNEDRLITYCDKNFIENKSQNIDFKCRTILNDGSEMETKIDSGIIKSSQEIKYAYCGDIYIISDNCIYQYDNCGEKLKYTYKLSSEEGSILSVCTISDYLVVGTNRSIIYYDMNTGKEIKKLDDLQKYIDDKLSIFAGDSSSEIILTNSKGLYKYDLSKDKIKEIFSGNSNSLSDKNSLVKQVIELPNNTTDSDSDESIYLIVYQNISDNSYKLCQYKYSKELSKAKKELISIYSLYENNSINDFIRIYQNKNPNVKINYEVGISTYGSIGESDAIKKLNTEVMAGRGPDILFLDRINSDYYEDKGLLEDISDIVDDKKDYLFNEITECYYDKDKMFKIPLRFSIPFIMGETNVISKINNLDSFNTELKNNYSDISTQIMYAYAPEDIVNLFYYQSSGDFIKNNKLNKNSIKKYLKTTKEIYKCISSKTPKNNYRAYNENKDEYIKLYGEELKYSQNLYLSKYLDPCYFLVPDVIKLDVGCTESLNELSTIISIVNKRKDISYKFFTTNGKNSFIPSLIVSLNAKSKNKDLAKKIISALFNEEYQSINAYEDGFPINMKALEGIYTENIGNDTLGSVSTCTNDGNEVSCDISWLSENDYNNLLSIIKELEEPVNTNTDILEAITIAAQKYYNGEMTLDEAVDYINKKVKIMLEE